MINPSYPARYNPNHFKYAMGADVVAVGVPEVSEDRDEYEDNGNVQQVEQVKGNQSRMVRRDDGKKDKNEKGRGIDLIV